jgi:hypothetical protein
VRLGKRTARLVRQAAVAGFVNGTRFAQGRSLSDVEANFPGDTWVVVQMLRTARAHPDLYPTMAKVESVDEAADATEAALKAEGLAMLTSLINGQSGVDTQ